MIITLSPADAFYPDLKFELVGWLDVKEARERGKFSARCNCWYVEPLDRHVRAGRKQ